MAAEKAGLKRGDVILAVNDSPVGTSTNLTDMLRDFRDGQEVRLRVQRDEEEIQARVVLTPPLRSNSGRGGIDRLAQMNRMGSGVSQRADGFELAMQHDTVLQRNFQDILGWKARFRPYFIAALRSV